MFPSPLVSKYAKVAFALTFGIVAGNVQAFHLLIHVLVDMFSAPLDKAYQA